MTTIACNRKEMAADTRITWEGVGTDQVSGVKIFAAHGALYGITGEDCSGSLHAIEWFQDGAPKDFRPAPPEYEHTWDWRILQLSKDGLAVFNERLEREALLEPMLAVGSGRKVALYCMKFLGMSPAEAVCEAAKVDVWTAAPIYVATLADMAVKRWEPGRKKRRKA